MYTKRKHIIAALALFIFLLCHMLPLQAATIPKPTSEFYVNDFANVLTPDTHDYVVKLNEKLFRNTGAQIVLVTLDTLDGSSIEEYSTELFRSYGIGDADKDNGVLLLLALAEREVRIEVGDGMEGALNDAKAGRILDTYVVPYFKTKKWDEGMKNGFDALLDVVNKEYNQNIKHEEPINQKSYSDTVDTILFILAFASIAIGFFVGWLLGGFGFIAMFAYAFIVGYFFRSAGADWNTTLVNGIMGILGCIFGFGKSLPDDEYGGSSGSTSYSGGSSRSSGGHSSHSGGGGHSSGGGASRKF